MSDIKNEQPAYEKEDLYRILDTVNSWIHSADNKASIFLAFVGVCITVIVTSSFFSDVCKLISDILLSGDMWLRILFIVASAVGIMGIIMLVAVIIPRIIRIPWLKVKTPLFQHDSFMFYGSIANRDYKAYEKQMHEIFGTGNLVIDDLIYQIHSASVICVKKMEYLQKSIVLLIFSSILLCACLIIGKLC